MLLAAPFGAAAQEPPDSLPITIGVGGMMTPAIDNSFKGGWDLLAGGGFAVSHRSHHRRWRLFFTGNFMYEHLGVTNAALGLAKMADTALQNATGARARFYSATFDPTFRYALSRRISIYGLGGFGWFQRAIEFTGAAKEGTLLPPGMPSILSPSGNSAAVDAGIGLNYLLRGPGSAIVFVEARYLRGLGINQTTSLAPVSVGFRW